MKKPLSQTHPALAEQWHPEKNGPLLPSDISAGSNKKVWWLANCGHSWETVVYARSLAHGGCPYCSRRATLVGFNDLATTHKALADEWDFGKNLDLTPTVVRAGSSKRVWWIGKCGHSFSSKVSDRTGHSSGCPYCSGNKILKGFNDLETTHPKLAKEWDVLLNNGLEASSVSAGSNKKVWWIGSCGHSFHQGVNNRAGQHQGCPYCANQKTIEGWNDLTATNPELSTQWHPTRNGAAKPSEFRFGSAKKFWWVGPCGHEWQATIGQRSKGHNCPYCSGRRVLKGFNDLETTHPELASEWHPTANGHLTPHEVSFGSTSKVTWLGQCGHEWSNSPNIRTANKFDCPICSNKRVIEGFNDLITTDPVLASQWHPTKNNPLSAIQVTRGSGKRIWWIGECNHEWLATIASRAGAQTGCPKCSVGGFSTADPGVLYFIHNPKLKAFKIGVTNPHRKSQRLSNFQKQGWLELATWSHTSGQLVLNLETAFLRWLRREMHVPAMLDSSDMGYLAGASETFSDEVFTVAEIKSKIEELLAEAGDQPYALQQ